MGYLEKQLYVRCEEIYGSTEREQFIKIFKRFLDDCCLLWNKSKERLLEFHQLLNNLHPKIKFTMEMSTNKLPFLDISLCKEGSKLHTDIYYKTTDTRQYFRSCHSKPTKSNIPCCLAWRICAIVSRMDIRERLLNKLRTFLKKQNYPDAIITKGIEKAKTLGIEELRACKKKPDNEKILLLVITNNPNNPNVTRLVWILLIQLKKLVCNLKHPKRLLSLWSKW